MFDWFRGGGGGGGWGTKLITSQHFCYKNNLTVWDKQSITVKVWRFVSEFSGERPTWRIRHLLCLWESNRGRGKKLITSQHHCLKNNLTIWYKQSITVKVWSFVSGFFWQKNDITATTFVQFWKWGLEWSRALVYKSVTSVCLSVVLALGNSNHDGFHIDSSAVAVRSASFTKLFSSSSLQDDSLTQNLPPWPETLLTSTSVAQLETGLVLVYTWLVST